MRPSKGRHISRFVSRCQVFGPFHQRSKHTYWGGGGVKTQFVHVFFTYLTCVLSVGSAHNVRFNI